MFIDLNIFRFIYKLYIINVFILLPLLFNIIFLCILSHIYFSLDNKIENNKKNIEYIKNYSFQN